MGGADRPTILITGAGRRLGRALALDLGRRGADLALHYHSAQQEAEELARHLIAEGARAETFRADLSREADQERLAEEVLHAFPNLNGLVNSASVYLRTPLATLDRAEYRRIQRINTEAPIWLSATLGSAMQRGRGGSIVQIGDWSTSRPYRDYLAYTVSKGALETATRALARELAPQVRVNMASLGPILLPEGSTADYAARVERAVAVGRIGGPEAFTSAVRHLLWDASYCSGTIMTVDGGRQVT